MDDYTLAAGVKDFVRRYVPSINHLEALIRLIREPDALLTPEEIAKSLGADVRTATSVLQDFVRLGVVAQMDSCYTYRPANDEVRMGCTDLLDANERLPVQLIRVIYERPQNPVQSFADAFRLRKE
jgi:hypothetical protein